MRNKLLYFLVFLFIQFLNDKAYSNMQGISLPSQMVILKLPDTYSDWKEISRSLTDAEGLVEFIPRSQKGENYSELIAIQYFNREKSPKSSIRGLLKVVREKTIQGYPGRKVTWKILEENKSDIIYEWILHEPYENIPPQHEISRIFLTDLGLHRIGFTRRNMEMGSQEREKWLKLLHDSVALVRRKEAINTVQGLSLVERRKSLDLGPFFSDWRVLKEFPIDSEGSFSIKIPSSYQENEYRAECLEVLIASNTNNRSMNQVLSHQKELFQEDKAEKIVFRTLKQSPNEIIYHFVYLQDGLQVTNLVRTFLQDQMMYSINYRRGLVEKMSDQDVLHWQKQLEIIKVPK